MLPNYPIPLSNITPVESRNLVPGDIVALPPYGSWGVVLAIPQGGPRVAMPFMGPERFKVVNLDAWLGESWFKCGSAVGLLLKAKAQMHDFEGRSTYAGTFLIDHNGPAIGLDTPGHATRFVGISNWAMRSAQPHNTAVVLSEWELWIHANEELYLLASHRVPDIER